MKAVLVIDMPRDCWDCHLVDEWGNCNAIKMTSARYGISVKQNDKERPSWCPLRPLPQKKDIRNSIQYRGLAEEYRKEGWNECIDEIMGEANERKNNRRTSI